MRIRPMHSCIHRSRGFSMVEAMVALLVLSVGMLGIAGLYVTSLRASGSALLRTQAVNLAADMADRIRANPTATVSYAGAGANNNCVGGGADCTPTALAADDLFWWQAQLRAALPDDGDVNTPQGSIAVVAGAAGAPSAYQITVTWVEPGWKAGDPLPRYDLRMQI
ncbi:MAG TPA: type IV pilus modification protein PilV [Steroidobacteraceae bacterium]|nr:type IV pilus modification protein PilV [Steroidobacteraceae bacterium]